MRRKAWPESDLLELIESAKEVLKGNTLGSATRPGPHLYPHQWNWDSGFIAIGYARYDQQRAQQELSTLFAAQWRNGMLPQIVFNRQALGTYFPEPDFWRAEGSPNHPEAYLTSGITMPPVHATAAWRVLTHARDASAAREWLRDLYPRLVRMHAYFYRERDPDRRGLAYIRHPWESGLDNSPAWDSALSAIEIAKQTLPDYVRKDLRAGVPREQRPTDEDYDRYVYLVDLFRRQRYDEYLIQQECPFLVQEPLFNSVLSKANEDLLEIGKFLGKDIGRIQEWHRQTNTGLRNKLWHEEHGIFGAFDMRGNSDVEVETASGFMPLFCGAASAEQARRLYGYLESNSFCPMHSGHCFSIPNYDLTGEHFDRENYWRGPIWINTNWLLMHGLHRYGFHEKAESVRGDIIELVRRWGFHEYFDPFDGRGYGTDRFSWTASLFIDVATEFLKNGVGPPAIASNRRGDTYQETLAKRKAAPFTLRSV